MVCGLGFVAGVCGLCLWFVVLGFWVGGLGLWFALWFGLGLDLVCGLGWIF